MKKLYLSIGICIALILIGASAHKAHAAITLIASTTVSGASVSAVTSTAINTTGATLIVVVSNNYFANPPTITDNASNTWHSLTVRKGTNAWTQIWYAYGPNTTSTHTFHGEGGSFPTLFVTAWSGTLTTSAVFDQESGAGAGSNTTSTPGSITPSQAGELFVTGVGAANSNSLVFSASGGFTIVNQQTLGFTYTGGADAYIIDATTVAENPTWTVTNGDGPGSAMAAFKAVDTTSPSVTLTAPTIASVVSSTVTVSASSTDNVAVSGVQFQIDGTNLGAEVTATSGPTIYSATWNTASSTDGAHTITAIAYDTSNNTSTATSSVTVSNAALTVTTSTSLTFSATSGDTATSSQSVVIKNSGTPSSTLSWSATSTQSWLTFGSSSGSLTGSATTSLSFIANPTGLSAGTQTATATISGTNASGSPQSFPVTFTIAAAAAASIHPTVNVAAGYSVGIPAGYILNPTSTAIAGSSSSPPAIIPLEAQLRELEATFQALLARAAARRIGGAGVGMVSGAVSLPSSPASFSRDLQLWDTGNDVKQLQLLLIQQDTGPAARALASHGATHTFGLLTYRAIREFQASMGLPPTGYFGRLTRAKMGY